MKKIRMLLCSIVVLIMLLMSPLQISAYNRSAARDYSNNWALSRNSAYKDFGNNDCTNFMSQALQAGGYTEQYNNPYWYMDKQWRGFSYTDTWINVNSLKWLLWAKNWGYWWGWQNKNSNTNDAWYGDILIFDWDQDGSWDHMAMEALYNNGTDFVNTHSNNHYHAIWNLQQYTADTEYNTALLRVNY